MTIDFITDDVIHWVNTYHGPRFHALFCDPPYELAFMGKKWDATGIAFKVDTWAALAEHLLPGAFLMAFAGCRTYHRMACAVEDAGMVIHSDIAWLFGSGFPKATNLSKAIDAKATFGKTNSRALKRTNEIREKIGTERRMVRNNGIMSGEEFEIERPITAPATPLARTWAGHRYGLQALKPAFEHILVAQKPYQGKPVESIVESGAGALNIEASRIPSNDNYQEQWDKPIITNISARSQNYGRGADSNHVVDLSEYKPSGRWPANLVLDSDAARALDDMSGERPAGKAGPANTEPTEADSQIYGFAHYPAMHKSGAHYGDGGGVSRYFFTYPADALDDADPFFYCAKSSRRERDAGLDDRPLKESTKQFMVGMEGAIHSDGHARANKPIMGRNSHPTVKPLALCRYLATLLLPPAEYAPRRLLVPFGGVGSEAIGAMQAGWDEIAAIEREAEYVEIGRARAEYWRKQVQQLTLPV